MANQITVNSGTGNITVTTSRAVIGTVANVASANYANFAGEVVDSSQPNITSVGTLSNLNVATTITTQYLVVTGNFSVGNLIANSANFANFAGEVVDASQPNITSVGILNGLVVSGNITPNANITYNLGNNTNRFNDLYLANSTIYLGAQQISANATSVNFSQDIAIAGNLSAGNLVANSANFANFAGTANTANAVAGANVSGTVANATFATSAGSANTANSATVAASANAVAGANVSGEVANANYASFANIANSANSVAVANVSGIGNIATVNLDSNASNVLFGNGTFGPEGSTGNANYANFAGTAFSVSGSNVSGEVANANFASYSNVANSANAVAGANVSGTVANATFATSAGSANTANSATVANSANSVAVGNVSGIGNIATVNLDGNASHALQGNGVFGPYAANASLLTGTTLNSGVVQSSLTSVGTLTGLSVNGNITAANISANTGIFTGNGSGLSAIAGANVSGTVANANYAVNANVANTANSVAVANVSGIGNIATVNLDGSSSNVLFGNGIFAPESTSIANANYANFAGDVVNSSQSNITSVGTLTSLTVSGNITGQSNVYVNETLVFANTVQINSPGYYLPYGFTFANDMPNTNVLYTVTIQGDVTSGSNVVSNVALSDISSGSPLSLSNYAPLLANLSLIPIFTQGVGYYDNALPILGTISNVDAANTTITYSNNFAVTKSLSVTTQLMTHILVCNVVYILLHCQLIAVTIKLY